MWNTLELHGRELKNTYKRHCARSSRIRTESQHHTTELVVWCWARGVMWWCGVGRERALCPETRAGRLHAGSLCFARSHAQRTLFYIGYRPKPANRGFWTSKRIHAPPIGEAEPFSSVYACCKTEVVATLAFGMRHKDMSGIHGGIPRV